MLRQLDIVYFMKAVMDRIEDGTGLKCYDHVEDNQKSPFCYVQLAGITPINTKTMFVDRYTVFVHIIAEPRYSSVPIYNYIQSVQEAMTEDIIIPKGFNLIRQISNGLHNLKNDETNEMHAVLSYEFEICYGFKCKI